MVFLERIKPFIQEEVAMIKLDGSAVSQYLRKDIQKQASQFQLSHGRAAKLVVFLVGEDKASHVYVRAKAKACEEVGIASEIIHMPASVKSAILEKEVLRCAQDKTVDGILVQMPLPSHLDAEKVVSLIPANKDVDGFTPEQVGRLSLGRSTIKPCTPAGIMEILKFYKINPEGMDAVVVGRSHIVGLPMAQLLIQASATVTVCHSKTRHMDARLRNADLVVVAAGKPQFLNKNHFKRGAIVIDVGIHRLNKNEKSVLVGDVDPLGLETHVAAYTPVPGGVGPMTITMLLKNTLTLAEARESL